MYRRVLIATDNTEFSQVLAREAVKEVSIWGAEVVVLFVVDARVSFLGELYHSRYEDFEAMLKEEGREVINSFKRLARLYGISLRGRIRKGVPGRVIVEQAAKEKADLIVLSAPSKAAPRKKYLREMKYVSRNAHCSVLVMRPGLGGLSAP